jgi:hypothetical protein
MEKPLKLCLSRSNWSIDAPWGGLNLISYKTICFFRQDTNHVIVGYSSFVLNAHFHIKLKGGFVMKTYIGRTTGVIVLFAMLASNAWAAGAGPGGIDILHVPMSWCIVDGSPAQANLATPRTADRQHFYSSNWYQPEVGNQQHLG